MIRRATAADAPQLITLMRKLAAFEGYADLFTANENDLIERGFTADTPQFEAWVIERDGTLTGYALIYLVSFTFDLRPTVVLKELFVDEGWRRSGAGRELFGTVVAYGKSINARLLRWQVLPDNKTAKRFYRRHGGERDVEWEYWALNLDDGRLPCEPPQSCVSFVRGPPRQLA